ncbi:hypothetical protein STENM223S_03240 [Streptomyces tendae]
MRAGRVRYEHDALGRIVVRQKMRLSGEEGHLAVRVGRGGSPDLGHDPGRHPLAVSYDPLGRRTAKRAWQLTAKAVIERDRLHLGRRRHSANRRRRSASAPRPGHADLGPPGPAARHPAERISAADAPQEEIDSRFFAIVTDLVGTPTELVDESGDGGVAHPEHSLGHYCLADGQQAYTPLRFPGQYYDPETGLHYNYFRHYDPETARYLTRDPLG